MKVVKKHNMNKSQSNQPSSLGHSEARTDAMLGRAVREIRRGGTPVIVVENELDRQRMLSLLTAKLIRERDAQAIAETVVRLPRKIGAHPTDVIDWSEIP